MKCRVLVVGISLLALCLTPIPANAAGPNVNAYAELVDTQCDAAPQCWEFRAKAITTGYPRGKIYIDYLFYVSTVYKGTDSDDCTPAVGSTGCTETSKWFGYTQNVSKYKVLCMDVISYQRNGARQQVNLESDRDCERVHPELEPVL